MIRSLCICICLFLLSCTCETWQRDVSGALNKEKVYLLRESAWLIGRKGAGETPELPLVFAMISMKDSPQWEETYFLEKGTEVSIHQLVMVAKPVYGGPIPSCSTLYGLYAFLKVPQIGKYVRIGLGPDKLSTFAPEKRELPPSIESWYLLDPETKQKACFSFEGE